MMSKIVIVGCGIIGAAIAYELSLLPELDITVIEQHSMASGSTRAALGVLMGVISQKKKGRAWRLRQTSLKRYQTLISELEAATGLSIPVNRQGVLKLLFEGDNLEQWQKLQEFRDLEGWELFIGDRAYLQDQCPHLVNDQIIGAVYSPNDLQINPVKLTEALVAAAQLNGVKFYFHSTVINCLTHSQNDGLKSCNKIETSQGEIDVDQLIISAGLGSTPISQFLQQTIPIVPVLGQAIRFKLNQPLGKPDFQPVITGNDIHIVPLGNQEYWLGATVEFPTPTAKTVADPQLLEQVKQGAIAFCPQLKDAIILETWSGKRPRPDGISAPIIDTLPGYSNVLLATAHYRNGVLLAPATALDIVSMVRGSLNC